MIDIILYTAIFVVIVLVVLKLWHKNLIYRVDKNVLIMHHGSFSMTKGQVTTVRELIKDIKTLDGANKNYIKTLEWLLEAREITLKGK